MDILLKVARLATDKSLDLEGVPISPIQLGAIFILMASIIFTPMLLVIVISQLDSMASRDRGVRPCCCGGYARKCR